MLDKDQTAAAAKTLHDHWWAGTKIGDLDLAQRPQGRTEGYAIQAAMQGYGSLFGWKIAATSEAGQKHINVAGPLAGRLFAERVIPDGGTASMAGNEMRVGEPEFAFRMGRSLPPRPSPYSVEDVLERRRYAASGDRTAGFPLRRFRQGRRGATDRGQCMRSSVRARRTDHCELALGRSGRGEAGGHAARPAFCRLWQECARRSPRCADLARQ